MSEVKLISITKPVIDGVNTAEELISFCARVSNPGNQMNNETSSKLLRYLLKSAHFSPFEMVDVCLEIKTTRDIGRQILRHRSFVFQEFSQRYAAVTDQFEYREARLQDEKNRQNSVELDKKDCTHQEWQWVQEKVANECLDAYEWALQRGIAKEQARAVLPEGMTKSTLYVKGSLRSFIHYILVRHHPATQKEHRIVAQQVYDVVFKEFPSLKDYMEELIAESA